MENSRLIEYARLIVKKGLNLDKGQSVVLTANLEQLDFVRTVIKECYLAGAGRVVVNWLDMEIDKMAQDFQTEESLSALMPWETARWQWMTENFPARLWLDSDDPDGMDGIDQEKYARTLGARLKQIKVFRLQIQPIDKTFPAPIHRNPYQIQKDKYEVYKNLLNCQKNEHEKVYRQFQTQVLFLSVRFSL